MHLGETIQGKQLPKYSLGLQLSHPRFELNTHPISRHTCIGSHIKSDYIMLAIFFLKNRFKEMQTNCFLFFGTSACTFDTKKRTKNVALQNDCMVIL